MHASKCRFQPRVHLLDDATSERVVPANTSASRLSSCLGAAPHPPPRLTQASSTPMFVDTALLPT